MTIMPIAMTIVIVIVIVNHTDDHHDDNHLGCTGPLSTEPGTGVADEGGELLVEGQAGDQGQHLS